MNHDRVRTTDLYECVRRTSLFRSLVPVEAGVGIPAPTTSAGRFVLHFPCFTTAPAGGEERFLFVPCATISLDWQTARPVEYIDHAFRSPWKTEDRSRPVARVGRDDQPPLSREERAETLHSLFRGYDELACSVLRGRELPVDWEDGFRTGFRLLVPAALHPYYAHVAPGFYRRVVV
jgi:hypothetical protein